MASVISTVARRLLPAASAGQAGPGEAGATGIAALTDVLVATRFRSDIRTPSIAIRPAHRNDPQRQRSDVVGGASWIGGMSARKLRDVVSVKRKFG